MKITNKLLLGIEIESEINNEFLGIEKGGYHEGEYLSEYWNVEEDSSLYRSGIFDKWGEMVEFVSNTLTENEFKKALKDFKEIISNSKEFELNQVINFNNSCGCHIHLSLGNFLFTKKVIFEVYPKVRKYFFEKIKKSNIESRDTILNRYSRHYSRLLTKRNFNSFRRYTEFNFYSELDNKGLEWRGVNLTGITTWKEFFEMFDIILDSIKYLCNQATKYQKRNYFTLEQLQNKKENDLLNIFIEKEQEENEYLTFEKNLKEVNLKCVI